MAPAAGSSERRGLSPAVVSATLRVVREKLNAEPLLDAAPADSLPDRAGETPDGGSDGLNGDNPFGGMLFTGRNFDVVDTLRDVAAEVGRPMAQVALAWVARRPAVATALVGASRPEQLMQNIASLDVDIGPKHLKRLDRIFGGRAVVPWR